MISRRRVTDSRRALLRIAVAAIVIAAFLGGSASALAAGESAAWWRLTSLSTPTYLHPGANPATEPSTLVVTATNLGTATAQASPEHPVTITDKLPPGLTVGSTQPVTCKSAGSICAKHWPLANTVVKSPPCEHPTPSEAKCTFEEPLAPYEQWEIQITVNIEPSAKLGKEEVNEVKVEGAGVPSKTLRRPLTVSNEPTPFGVEDFEVLPEDDHGEGEAQAGAHPFQFTTTFALNRIYHEFPGPEFLPTIPELPKDVHVNLPPGLIGNANKEVIHQCPELLFASRPENGKNNLCPEDTAIGVAVTTITEPDILKALTIAVPVYNLVPSKGEPARFGFTAVSVPVTLDTVVREGDYHVVVNANNVSQEPALLSSQVTIWGVPGDSRHDQSRGSQCLTRGSLVSDLKVPEECVLQNDEAPLPFLTLPTSCPKEPLQSSVRIKSWLFGSPLLDPFGATSPETLEGCDNLPAFAPSMTVQALQQQSNTPTGLKVVLKVPQPSTRVPDALAESAIRNTTVKLPPGLQLSPSAGNGLETCSLAQIGFRGVNPSTETIEFGPNPDESNPARCPDGSKVGTVEIKTPVLEQPLHGSVYLAAQEENPFNSLFAIYIVVEDPITGVLVKLAGKVDLDPVTGQITNTFPNAPQLPFEELTLELFNGPRASIATPRACGPYSTFTAFTPWSGQPAVEALLNPEEFNITSGPHGTGCANPQPFNPGIVAGTTNNQAAAFTGFTLSLTRPDTDQLVNSLSVTLPQGLAGIVKNVEQCPEAQANAGTCGPGSRIGSVTAVVGLGDDPFTVTGGSVYLTEKYKGAPFGLSIVLPAKVGNAFDFGIVVTRATINVDPNTAAITINTPEVPTMVNTLKNGAPLSTGAPAQLRRVDVTVDRPEFQFNPTNCSPLKITGGIGGDQGASAPIALPFQVTGCNKLPFAPTLTAETSANVTKTNGTSLVVKVTSSPGQANIGKTKIAFPEQLPSRLTTIQKACRDTIFEVNPANCPEGSVIGQAVANTPVLKNPLTGPAYLVSHGNAAFPDAEFVLQGEGLTLILDGKTDIKKGITTSEFNTVPDAPVSTFVVTLPAGPHSAFTGHGDLCKPTKTVTKKVTVKKRVKRGKRTRVIRVRKTVKQTVADPLKLPTILTGQNGNVIEKSTPLKVTGCKPAKKAIKHKASNKKKKHKKKGKKKK